MPHKKSRKVRRGKKTGRKTMKMKRGGYYGFGQSAPVAVGAASVTKGTEVPLTKGGKRSRRASSRRGRKMRGGAGGWSVVKAAGFNGESVGNGNAVFKPVYDGRASDVVPTE
jgi:hypothetical protein